MKLTELKSRKLAEYQRLLGGLKPNQLLPPLTEDEYAALRADIAEHGVIVPVQINDDGTIIDGHHRIAIAEDLGAYCPHEILYLTEAEAQSMAIKLNTHRRQLNQAQKRELLATLIKAEPEKSDRQHAKIVGASDKTAGSVRRELEGRAEIPHVEDRTDSLGRTQPAKARLETKQSQRDKELAADRKKEQNRLKWIEQLIWSLADAIHGADSCAHPNNIGDLIAGWRAHPELRTPLTKNLKAAEIRTAAEQLNRIADLWTSPENIGGSQ